MKLYMAAILAISFLDIFNEGIVRGSFGSQVMPENRCTDLYTEEIDVKRIAGYENHERPIKAVIFITNRGFRICVKHDLLWVQNAIQKLDQKPKPKTKAHKKPKPSSRRRAISTSRPKARTS